MEKGESVILQDAKTKEETLHLPPVLSLCRLLSGTVNKTTEQRILTFSLTCVK